ncbi:MAG: prolyl oligopeptidase family serine peptidase [Clostridiales bacterium]|nr:prolyl oligopeptidase family serine peptidase [Clostridiales bacterium]
MSQSIPIINQTLELAEVKDQWFFDEKYNCWCLEDVLYTLKATTPKFQRLSIFVPAPYMKEGGEIDPEGSMNGFTAATAPVIMNNNSAGYMEMPHMWLGGPRCFGPQYLERGFVYVTCGNRGRESKDANGRRSGKIPSNLVDLKTVIRFLRHNADVLPGDMEKIISVGWSAGGAMSTLLAVTGNNKNYDLYLEESGAFMDERDDVYASQIYCPIIDLEHADLAYEWMFSADKENEPSPAGPGGVMTPFEEALSAKLRCAYIEYFNGLALKNPDTDEPLVLNADGRSGSAYDYLMAKIDGAATKFLTKLSAGELDESYTADDYIKGNYTFETMAPVGGDDEKDGEPDDVSLMQGHAGPGVALNKPPVGGPDGNLPPEPPTLGNMLSRPPKGVPTPPPFEPPMMTVQGKDKSSWLSWDGEQAFISDLDSYVLNHRRRMKPCTSFDILSGKSGENEVYGTPEQPAVHFSTAVADAIASLKEEFPAEYAKYYPAYVLATGDSALTRQLFLNNPLNFIGTEEESDQAKYYRVRVGASDADTSFMIGMTLALELANAGKPVDYALVWDKPHCEADYPGEVCDWIESICK